LVVIASMWGSSFIFMKMLVPELGFAVTSLVRLTVGGSIMACAAMLQRKALSVQTEWHHYLIIGLLNSAVFRGRKCDVTIVERGLFGAAASRGDHAAYGSRICVGAGGRRADCERWWRTDDIGGAVVDGSVRRFGASVWSRRCIHEDASQTS
jgi:hypothetical protein